MELLYDLFIQWGGFSVWLFIIGVPPQTFKNYQEKKYMSGSIWTWILFITAHFLFGLYMFLVGDYVVMAGQVVGFTFVVLIITQYFIYPHPD